MNKYALLIIERNVHKSLAEDCKALSEILEDSNTKLDSLTMQGIGSLLFDLRKDLIPFCKVTASAYKLGHPVHVLFLEDKNSFLLQDVESQADSNVDDFLAKLADDQKPIKT